MIPGFVQLGILVIFFQVLGIAGFYAYLRWQRPAAGAGSVTRAEWILASGVGLLTLGQLAGLGAIGSLRTAPLLSLRQAMVVQNVSLLAALAGYGIVVVGFVLYSRDSV
ncbi:hypothetical protein ACFQMA_01630 [Halosimplex aquaticum]|uniref:Uncharacterized protein n=1 Tax=Halosimplex aquaticum TaxID=3026162 RepID=A0ABD5XTZ2_9EURY|nr:hypothetical protein [Halosimplex aquaticum]